MLTQRLGQKSGEKRALHKIENRLERRGRRRNWLGSRLKETDSTNAKASKIRRKRESKIPKKKE